MTNSKIVDIETTGLTFISDRIICISSIDANEDTVVSFYDEDEKIILEDFWNFVKDTDELITYNGDWFDIPFIVARTIINNIKIPESFKKIKLVDVRKVVSFFQLSDDKYVKGKLSDWAEILGIKVKTQNGSFMEELFRLRMWDEIKKHGEEDVIITKALFNRCKDCNLI